MTNAWPRLMLRWSQLVFKEKRELLTPKVRSMRLLEEALELAQAEGVTQDQVGIITVQVYSKYVGRPFNELGGVLCTLASYAGTKNYDLDEAFYSEFERIMDPAMMEKVRNRNLNGDKIGLKPLQDSFWKPLI